MKRENEAEIFFCDMMTLLIMLLNFYLAEDDYSYSEFRPGKQKKTLTRCVDLLQ